MSRKSIIRVDNLRRHFKMGQELVQALDGVSLDVQEGELLGVTGPSGSGKSTLLYMLGGLDHPTSGRIWVNGEEISTLDEDGLAAYRQHTIGFIFQLFNLIPTMTALENVEFPLLFTKNSTQQRRKRATALLELVGLEERLNHRPTELSGGQQQRVAIARALVNDPPLILADEPTGNLDSHSGSEVMSVLIRLNQQGRTIVLVSHDPHVIGATRHSIRLHDGRIMEEENSRQGAQS
jgi:putative ABC transport system ATP-binding protein